MNDIDKIEAVREDFVKWEARNPGATLWDAFKAGKGITPPALRMIPVVGEVGADGNVKFTAALPTFPIEAASDAVYAARYRWLREQQWNTSDVFVVAGGKSNVRLGTDCPFLSRLDEVIDAALAAKGE